jgi:hypothetical protein
MKKGIIKITDELYRNNYNEICKIFNYFKPTHIEFRHWENDIWYLYGESDLFEEIKEGEQIPFYLASFLNTKTGYIFSNFEKIKN